MQTKIQRCASMIQQAQKIIVMTGAGISTSAGIPDFRSPGTGLYYNLQKYNLPYPEAIFDLDYFCLNPQPFFELARELAPSKFQPTITHRFIRLLEEKGKLLRDYTQNIDGLERSAHIERLIECHGSFKTATCLVCARKYQLEDIIEAINNQRIPFCSCQPRAVIKPDVVFFGESMPSAFFESIPLDFPMTDLLLIMGTSLNVHPVADLVHEIKANCPVILINNTPCHLPDHLKTELLLGDCDQSCADLSETAFGIRL